MKNAPKKMSRKMQPALQQKGQAVIEYSLILILGFLGLVAILLITAPAVGNVFSNTVYNLLGQTTTPQEPLDPDEFWDLVTSVASFTPESPALVTNTPRPNTAEPTATTEISPTPTLPTNTPLPTDTPGPSPTPEDEDYDYPFNDDASDEDAFYDERPDLFESNGPLNAEFWDDWSGSHCADGNRFDANTGEISYAAAGSYQVEKINFPDSSNSDNYWRDDYDQPHPSVGSDFCSRFEVTFDLTAGDYDLRYLKDDGVRIYLIEGGSATRIVNDWNWSPNYANEQITTFNIATAGTKTFRIVHRDTGGGAELQVALYQGGEASSSSCNWELDDSQYHSSPTSWHDSLSGDYSNNSTCVLTLRGTIDLTGAVEPKITFFERVDLDRYDDVKVSVSIANTGQWRDITIHTGPHANLSWTRQEIDLRNFVDDLGGIYDFRNQVIELRFVLETDGNRTDPGWWLDDIEVKEVPERVFYLGFQDDVEGEEFWEPEGEWGRGNETGSTGNILPHSGSNVWADSLGSNYNRNSNSSLTLDGRLDLSASSPIAVVNPEVVFWHSYDINWTDRIFVEVSNDRATWTAMATRSISGNTAEGSAIVTGRAQDDYWSFVSATIPSSFIGQDRVYIRFRLQADGSSEEEGWWIDDIEFRNRPDTVLTPDFCESFDGGFGNWLPSGEWGLTSSQSYSGAFSMHDSPGSNYNNGSNYAVELSPYIDLSGSLTRPIIEFWHKWDIGDEKTSDDRMIVEVSQDDGLTWNQVFFFQDGETYPGHDPATLGNWWDGYDRNWAWKREVIELSSYIGFPSGSDTVPGLKLRFRVDATRDNDTDDGWYIDNFCILDHVDPVVGLPFADDMEAGSGNWIANGDWLNTSERSHSGTQAWSDSPFGNYSEEEFSLLELRPTIDLSGTTNPAFYYWARYRVGDDKFFSLEYIETDANGQRLTNWTKLATTNIGENTRNDAWVRLEADLTPFVGRYLRFRIHQNTLDGSGGTTDGVYVDDVRIIDRATEEQVYDLPYSEDVEVVGFGEYVNEHEWDTVTVTRSFGSGASLGPGQWEANWYDSINNACSSSAYFPDPPVGTSMVDEIDFNWYSGREWSIAGLTNSNTWGATFVRTLFFSEDTDITFTGYVDDGLRILVDGTLIREYNWDSCGNNNLSDSGYGPYTFSAGIHVVEIQYYENWGNARLRVDFEGDSQVFTDSPSGNYDDDLNVVLELEGTIDLTTVTNPVLFYDESYYVEAVVTNYVSKYQPMAVSTGPLSTHAGDGPTT